jgi:hypothetical protein
MTTIEDIKTELREIIELSSKAAPAPWRWTKSSPHIQGEEPTYDVVGPPSDWFFLESDKDATLIAASRNLTPKMAKALLTAIQVLEGMAQPLNCECSDEALRAYEQDSAIAKEALETIRREWEVQE